MKKTIVTALLISSLLPLAGCAIKIDVPKIDIGDQDLKANFGKLYSKVSEVVIPGNLFGSSPDNIKGAVIEVFYNGKLSESFEAEKYYNSKSGNVVLTLEELSEGDSIAVVVKPVSEDPIIYSTIATSEFSQGEGPLNCKTTTNAAEQIICSICEKVTSCSPSLTEATCVAALTSSNQVQLGDEIGVPEEENSVSMEAIIQQVENHTLTADPSSLSQCLTDINALTCNDIQNGYESQDPDNFDNTENFVPGEDETSCGAVFGG